MFDSISTATTPSSTSSSTEPNFWEEEIIKQGAVWKKGGGESLFGRKNWKLRWFILWRSQLCYYKSDPCWRQTTTTTAPVSSSTQNATPAGNYINVGPAANSEAPVHNRLLKKRSNGSFITPANLPAPSSSSSTSSKPTHRRSPSSSTKPKEIASALASSSSSSSSTPVPSSLASSSGAEAAVAAQLHAISQPLGRIQLKDVIGVQPVHEGTSRSEKDFCLKVVTPHRIYYLATKDYGVTAEWITELRQLMFEFQNPGNVRLRTGSLLQPAKSLDNIFTSFENSPKILRATHPTHPSAPTSELVSASSFIASSPPASPIPCRNNSPSNPRRGTISVAMLPILGQGRSRSSTTSSPPTPRKEFSLPAFPAESNSLMIASRSPPTSIPIRSRPIRIEAESFRERNISLGDIFAGTSTSPSSPPQTRSMAKPSLCSSSSLRGLPKLGRSPVESGTPWESPISSIQQLLTDSSIEALDLIEL